MLDLKETYYYAAEYFRERADQYWAWCNHFQELQLDDAGICDFAMMLNEEYIAYVELANDPPRTDFHIATRVTRNPQPISANADYDNIWNAFRSSHKNLVAALHAMLTSIERLTGARLALRSGGHDPNSLASHILKQRSAISHNALVAGDEIQALRALRAPLNKTYLAALKQSGITLDKQLILSETNRSGSRRDALQDRLRIFLSEVNDTHRTRRLFLDSDEKTHIVRSQLLDDRWDRIMDGMARSLDTFTSKPRVPRRLYEKS
ncbi:MAG: hypothetical protein H6937_06510 [Burkholderiales bacterium]|nr:hypothetical protein [Burkholderiales bacterium]MDR4515989.1 hypothetical protein [Nitrosomonas sp.]